MADIPPANAVLKASMSAVIHRACTNCGAANSKKLAVCEACGAPTPHPEYLSPTEVNVSDLNENFLLAWWRRYIDKER